jgi:uncharacterized protein (TIGR03435 family)
MAQSGAAGNPTFDVASVKPNKSGGEQRSNVPLGTGTLYSPTGGLFSAANVPLSRYISFAYKISLNQLQPMLAQMPSWVTTDGFDIQARCERDPGKDGMRLMMRALLADRFKLAVHSEIREEPVLALVAVTPGKTGPQLRPHPIDSPCSTELSGFPSFCGGVAGGMPPTVPGRQRMAGRGVTIEIIAMDFPISDLDRQIVNQTGLSGTFDFTLEWVPESNGTAQPPGVDSQSDLSGPSFLEALTEQLGLKLRPTKAPVDVLVFDHVERPSEN